MEPFAWSALYCEKCGKELNRSKAVWLELDQRIGEFHDFGGVPENLSQGAFPFGSDCAALKRRKARKALEKIAESK